MLGDVPLFQDPPDPSNIIWECVGVSEEEKDYKTLITYLKITGFIIACFLLFTALMSKSGDNKNKYMPMAIDQCS